MQETLVWFLGMEDLLEKGGYPFQYSWASLVAQLVKNLPTMWETWVDPWAGKILWRRKRLPTPIFWPGEFHELYSPWGHKESDMTEWFFTFTILTGVKWYFTVVVIYISLIISNTDHLSLCLLVICVSSLEKGQVKTFSHFLKGLFICCSCCWIVWAVCIF